MSERVLLVGIDGGDFRTIDPLCEAGEMPTLESLLEDGYHATLESSVPPWTPTAWTSMTSGKNPGKHGIFDFNTPDGERLVNATDVRTNRIWEYLSAAGSRSIVVNVPVTDPAPEIDGIVVPGFLGPEFDRMQAHPDGILDDLHDEIGEYRVYADDSIDDDEARCEEYVRLMRMRRDAISHLCRTSEWAFAMVEFQAPDLVFHELPEDRYIERVYRKLDEFIGDVIDAVDPETVLLASDHGMGEMGAWDIRLNAWLKQQGYLETSVDGREHGWEKPTELRAGETSGGIASAARGLSRIGLTPQRLESGFARLGLAGLARRAVPDSVLEQLVDAGEKIDEEASTAYFPSSSGLGIYCDDEVREELLEGLSSLVFPDGSTPVFERVEPAADVFDGPFSTAGPDIVIAPHEFDAYVSATVSSSVFDRSRYRFNHKPEGILIASGKHVRPPAERQWRQIHDVAPTVLALLDTPLDIEFDGAVIEEIVDKPVETKAYSLPERGRGGEDLEAVHSRLGELGYLE